MMLPSPAKSMAQSSLAVREIEAMRVGTISPNKLNSAAVRRVVRGDMATLVAIIAIGAARHGTAWQRGWYR
jgi:hypothetical protein